MKSILKAIVNFFDVIIPQPKEGSEYSKVVKSIDKENTDYNKKKTR
jgi:hypothetical protein